MCPTTFDNFRGNLIYVELGYSFNNTLFTVNDIEFIRTIGGLALNSKEYSEEKNEVIDYEIEYFDFANGKFECSSLTGNYRKVKPTTLLTKLQEHRERAESAFKQEKEQKIAFAKVIAELQAKCPAADVLSITEGVKYGIPDILMFVKLKLNSKMVVTLCLMFELVIALTV